MTAYYNEFDPYAAEWLRNLISAGHIAPGDVDERSISDVRPDDLRGYTQCHFFAGIGVWSYALRRAGWPDERPVWTGSCPCQPFSAAGKGAGFADERHLWPHFHWLIAQRRPAVVFGEQVASKAVDDWIDLVQDDVEALDYAFGAVPFPAAGVGAPHIRDRTFWIGERRLAHADRAVAELAAWVRPGSDEAQGAGAYDQPDRPDIAGGLADPGSFGRYAGRHGHHGWHDRPELDADEQDGGLADAGLIEREHQPHRECARVQPSLPAEGAAGHRPGADSPSVYGSGRAQPSPTNGFWRDADWLFCRDGKWRPVEPGTFPLAHGAPARVGRLRAYGNAIVAQAAQAFVESYLEARP